MEEEEEKDETHNYNGVFHTNAADLYLWPRQLFPCSVRGGEEEVEEEENEKREEEEVEEEVEEVEEEVKVDEEVEEEVEVDEEKEEEEEVEEEVEEEKEITTTMQSSAAVQQSCTPGKGNCFH